MFDEPTISFVPYTNEDLVKAAGYNGFISPDGSFYKVIKRDRMESAHDRYVQAFTDMVLHIDLKAKYDKLRQINPNLKNLSYKDMFINVLGYVNYEKVGKRLVVGCPDPKINNQRVTKKQMETILQLIKINKDSTNEITGIFDYDHKFNDYEVYRTR